MALAKIEGNKSEVMPGVAMRTRVGVSRYISDVLDYVDESLRFRGRVLFVTDAHKIYDRFVNTISGADPNVQRDTLKAIVMDVLNIQDLTKDGSEDSQNLLERLSDENFNRVHEMAQANGRIEATAYKNKQVFELPSLDPAFRDLQVVRNEAPGRLITNLKVDEKTGTHLLYNAKVWTAENSEEMDDEKGIVLSSMFDQAGVTTLLRHVSSRSEANKALKDLETYYEANPTQFPDPRRLEVMADVLGYLDSHGVPYRLQANPSNGQLTAHFEGLSLRVMDNKTDEQYIGRLDKRGVSSRVRRAHYENQDTGKDANKNVIYGPQVYIDMIQNRLGITPFETDRAVQRAEHKGATYRLHGREYNTDYMTGGGAVSGIGKYRVMELKDDGSVAGTPGRNLVVTTEKVGSFDYRSDKKYFVSRADAKTHIEDLIKSARQNFNDRLNLEGILIGDVDSFEFDEDPTISDLQRSYFKFLTGDAEELPGYFAAMLDKDEEVFDPSEIYQLADYSSREALVRKHLEDAIDMHIGTMEPQMRLRRTVETVKSGFDYTLSNTSFDPVNVLRYASSPDTAVAKTYYLSEAIRESGIPLETIVQGGYDRNNIVADARRFDEKNMINPLTLPADDLRHQAALEVLNGIHTAGVKVNEVGGLPDIRIDSNGTIRYTGSIGISQSTGTKDYTVRSLTGYVGPVVPRNEDGTVTIDKTGSDPYVLLPGYKATIRPVRDGEVDPGLPERMTLRGYEQEVLARVRTQVIRDIEDATVTNNVIKARDKFVEKRGGIDEFGVVLGGTNSIANVASRLYAERWPINYMEEATKLNRDPEMVNAVKQTILKQVQLPEVVVANGTGASFGTAITARMGTAAERNKLRNDTVRTGFALTRGADISMMGEGSYDGYFDPNMTGSQSNQGRVLYMAESASVDPVTGLINKGKEGDHTPIYNTEFMKHMDKLPFDRMHMGDTNTKSALAFIQMNVGYMNAKGFNMEDGFVARKGFAERNYGKDEDGDVRSLMRGDKLVEKVGNKGVISLVVDPDMDLEEAREKGIEELVLTFRNNPDLDVLAGPYAPVSRLNAGGFVTAMDRERKDLVLPDGTVVPKAIATVDAMISDAVVDKKTNVYDSETVLEGGGRKASVQLSWALSATGSDAIAREFYSNNDGALKTYREYLIAMGMDISETGKLRMGYKAHEGEERRIFDLSDYPFDPNTTSLNKDWIDKRVSELIKGNGGFLKVPFAVNSIAGEPFTKDEDGNTLIPILSSGLRSGREMVDGSQAVHDYTRHYRKLIEAVIGYEVAEKRKELGLPLRTAKGEANAIGQYSIKGSFKYAPLVVQAEMDAIASDIRDRRVNAKHNFVKEGIMSNRLENSATAVWSADPRLQLDEVSMSSKMARKLGFKDGEYAMIWRDPVIHDGASRGLKVVIDDELTGVAINPVIAHSFEGDFDGDTVAVVKLSTLEAQRDLRENLSQDRHIIDVSKTETIDGVVVHPLNFNLGLELDVVKLINPAYDEELKRITLAVNDAHAAYTGRRADGSAFVGTRFSEDEFKAIRREEFAKLSQSTVDAFKQSPMQALSFESYKAHFQSINEVMVKNGIKGSRDKIDTYAAYAGCRIEWDENGDVEDVDVVGEVLIPIGDRRQTMRASMVKNAGIGFPGAITQKVMTVLREHLPKDVLDMTHPVTQSLLQAKHDAAEGNRKYSLVSSIGQRIWCGNRITLQKNEIGESVWVEDMNRRLTKEQWVDQFCEFYNHKEGLNMPVERYQVEMIAEYLTDEKGMMIDLLEEGLNKYAAPLDRLCYFFNGNDAFESLTMYAREGRDLFDGAGEMFLTESLRKNREIAYNREHNIEDDRQMKQFTKGDVQADKVVEEKLVETVDFDATVVEDVEELTSAGDLTTEEKADTMKLNVDTSARGLSRVSISQDYSDEALMQQFVDEGFEF